MNGDAWNHNIHYHDLVLRALPAHAQRALDVGCGQSLLARQLAIHCEEVIAIDKDHATLVSAEGKGNAEPRVKFIEGDVMTYPFPDGSFDVITIVAALHHLPLKPALERFRDLLRPGGVLAAIGLFRSHTLVDFAYFATAMSTSYILRCAHRYVDVGAPLQDPQETLREIRTACDALLPGSVLKRQLLFRYSLIWRKEF